MKSTHDYSLERQDNLAQEEGNSGLNTQGRGRQLDTGGTHYGEGAIKHTWRTGLDRKWGINQIKSNVFIKHQIIT